MKLIALIIISTLVSFLANVMFHYADKSFVVAFIGGVICTALSLIVGALLD